MFQVLLYGEYDGVRIASYPSREEAEQARNFLVNKAKEYFYKNWFNKKTSRDKNEIEREIEREIVVREFPINPLNEEFLEKVVDSFEFSYLHTTKR